MDDILISPTRHEPQNDETVNLATLENLFQIIMNIVATW